MKRCPECRRDYVDDSLLYCLEDGAALIQGSVPSPDEPATAIIPSAHETNEDPTRSFRSGDIPSVTNPAFEQPGAKAKSKLYAGVAAAVLILVAGFFGYRYYSSTASGQIASIAVMPFTNESGNADVEYLSDGMTETLISSLSQVPNLNVKGRSSVFRYKGKDVDTKTIGKDLGVQAVLYGRVNQRGDQLTLSLELLDASTENVLWSGKYDRKQADVVSLQSEVARDVSGKLKSKLSGADAAKIEKSYTANPEAYQLYLKGRFNWNRRTSESLIQAVDFFKQAIAKDPNYALAYSGIAESYMVYSAYSIASPADSMPQAKAAALRAMELDDSLAAPHATLGSYLAQYEWDRAGSDREYRRAIELDPNYATARQWYGTDVLCTEKRFDEAVDELKRAEELDPLSPIIGTNLGDVFVNARRYDEGIAQYKRVLLLDPNFGYAHQALGWAYGAKGSYPEAIAETRKAFELNQDPQSLGYLGLWLARSGQREEATKLLGQLKQEVTKRYVPGYSLAIIYVALNEKEEALNWIEKDVNDHSFITVSYGVSPEFDDLRPEPRFKEMLKRMNLPE
jgi:TolB-like protein/Tfp pilus assembly protein PilF